MALATTLGVTHVDLGERPQYGQPYPDGIAVASSQAVDDASGGTHTFSILADPGFLYRLELVNWTRGEETLRVVHAITVHRWIAAKTPDILASFDLNWFLHGATGSSFSQYTIGASPQAGASDNMAQLRRFPMGAALGGGAPGVAVQLMLLTVSLNVDTITNEISVVWTYWRKEALYLPGFLSAFYEAPTVPPLVRSLF